MIAGEQRNTNQNPILQSRILLGQGMKEGFEQPEEFEPDLLLRGQVHHIYSQAGTGKSFVALWLIVQAIRRGERVLYIDMENGPHIIEERLAALGVEPDEIDEQLVYVYEPSLSMTAENLRNWLNLLDELDLDLIVFDSWVGLLAAAQLEENSNDDITQWAAAYARTARNREITVLILDHVPHNGQRSRGASRKRDEIDVQWQLMNTQPFDRDTVGEVVLSRKKDRQGWLPLTVKFSIGGTEDGFVCQRSEGTFEQVTGDMLTKTQEKALMVIRSNFRENGVRFNEWQRAVKCGSATLSRAIKVLTNRGLVVHVDERYFLVDIEEASA